MSNFQLFLFYVPFFTVGIGLELILYKAYLVVSGTKPQKGFSLSKYLYLIASPVIGTVIYAYLLGIVVVFVYFTFSVLGTCFEWLVGYSYHKLMGERLWTYHHASLGDYTSIYSAPLWGFLGIVFWLLARVFI